MKTILIAVGNPHLRFNSNHSAVASYLNTFKLHLLAQGYNVILSDVIYHSVQSNVNRTKIVYTSFVKKFLKRVAPRLFRTLSDRKLVQQIDDLTIKLLDKVKPDFVIEFLDYYSQIAYEFKKHQNVPYLLIYDAPIQQKYVDIFTHTSDLKELLIQRESNSINHANNIICYSEPVWSYLQKKFSTSAAHQILPTIVWERMIEKTIKDEDDVLTIGFIGSFLKWHYVDVLVKVFNQLADKYSNINLLLIGYGLEWDNINELIGGLKHKSRITLTGFAKESDMVSLKNLFDIGVMAGSNWYGSPLKIFEYAKLNIPVVGPDSPTVLDLFEKDKELLIVDSAQPEESLYNHLECLIINPERRKQLAEALRSKVDNTYSKKHYFSCFDKIVEANLNKV